MALTLITPPAREPVSVTEAKLHLRVDHSQEDDYIAGLITAAREHVEDFCNRSLLTQTWLLTLDHFPGRGMVDSHYIDATQNFTATYPHKFWIALYRPPLLGVTTLKYIDANGVLTTMDPSLYQVDTYSEPGRVALGVNQIWPWTELSVPQPVLNAVQITYTAGFGVATVDGDGNTSLPTTFPRTLRHAILLTLAHWFENRETVLTGVRAAGIEVPESAKMLMWMKRTSI